MKFELSIQDFKGPIEALLTMIEKRKLPINDISLSEITDEYLAFVQSLEKNAAFEHRIHFTYTASTLTLIKAKSLLPDLFLNEEEEHDIETLKHRLALYQFFQDAGLDINSQYTGYKQFYEAQDAGVEITFRPHESINNESLADALGDLLLESRKYLIAPQSKKEASIKIAIHIEEIMSGLKERIEDELSVNFNTYLKNKGKEHTHLKHKKVFQVVSFLALLELVRNHGFDVQQDHLFSDISLEQ